MLYFSEKTKQTYNTAEECLEAEKKFLDQEAKEKALKEQQSMERKAAAEKVEAARKALLEAQKTYQTELEDFCKKYKTYHYSIKSDDELPHFWDWFLNL